MERLTTGLRILIILSMIQFFNTLHGRVEEFRPLTLKTVKLYTCGPTVYDFAHIGNFRTYIFEDLLKRFLLFSGYEVTHVMNITDIDDKTIKGANSQGVSLQEYTREYTEAFFRDIEALNILKADHYPRATEHIPEMAHMAKGLVEKGFAYSKDGSIYFNIAKFPEYGKLSKIDPDNLKAGQRMDSDEYEKDNAHDFALWKSKKPGEPFWSTEAGTGRPGWHLECSVMSSKYLGSTFDIHCGGVDNIFPHHENEIAQSEAYNGRPFVRYWLHCHHLIVDGEKMSKSKGNCYTLQELLNRHVDPIVLRFLLLSTHYRKNLNFSFNGLEQARTSLKRLKDFLHELRNAEFPPGENQEITALIQETRGRFIKGLSDDLNISTALTAAFQLVKKSHILHTVNKLGQKDAEHLISALLDMDRVFGVLHEKQSLKLPASLLAKIDARQQARKDKKFQLADELRADLLRHGVQLEDTKDGVRYKIVDSERLADPSDALDT